MVHLCHVGIATWYVLLRKRVLTTLTASLGCYVRSKSNYRIAALLTVLPGSMEWSVCGGPD